jgi:hypothetical protein
MRKRIRFFLSLLILKVSKALATVILSISILIAASGQTVDSPAIHKNINAACCN